MLHQHQSTQQYVYGQDTHVTILKIAKKNLIWNKLLHQKLMVLV